VKRRLALAVVGAALGAALATSVAAPAAVEAVPSGDVVGRYRIVLKGEGFGARPSPKDDGVKVVAGKVSGGGTLEVEARDADVNDGIVTVRITLDPATAQTLLGPAVGNPPFTATAALVGDSIALIDAGQPNYVNAVVLRFHNGGRKVSGSWMAAFPAQAADLGEQGFATGVTVLLTGRRIARDGPGNASSR
jgi:hypothetical protein